MSVTVEEVRAAEAAVDDLYRQTNDLRRAESQRVFGHTGASIAGCHVTLTDAVTAALRAAAEARGAS